MKYTFFPGKSAAIGLLFGTHKVGMVKDEQLVGSHCSVVPPGIPSHVTTEHEQSARRRGAGWKGVLVAGQGWSVGEEKRKAYRAPRP
jgi:hypothetical protein